MSQANAPTYTEATYAFSLSSNQRRAHPLVFQTHFLLILWIKGFRPFFFFSFLTPLLVFHVVLNQNKTHCLSPHTLHESNISLAIPFPTHYSPLSPLILERLSEHWMSTYEQCCCWVLSSWLPQQHSTLVAFLPHGISSSPNKDGNTREQCLSDQSQGVFQDAGWPHQGCRC